MPSVFASMRLRRAPLAAARLRDESRSKHFKPRAQTAQGGESAAIRGSCHRTGVRAAPAAGLPGHLDAGLISCSSSKVTVAK